MNRPTNLGFALALTLMISSCSEGGPSDPGLPLPDDDPPTAIILTPGASDVFSVYEPITFSGKATDLQDGNDCCVATFKWSFFGASATTVGTGTSFVTDSVPIGNLVQIRVELTDLDGHVGANRRSFKVDVGSELLFGARSDSEIHRTDGLSTAMFASGQNPAWSPDGSQIAFAANDGTDLEIFVIDADGNNLIQVSDNSANDSRPTWSPDGTRLAYTSDITGNLDIWAIDVVTRTTTQITTHPANDDEADWTGSVIAFYSERDADGDKEIFKVSDDLSSAPVQLTFNTVEDRDPQWTPNGAQILFSRDGGDSEIYIMSANGLTQTNLTNNPAEDTDARISPDLTKIVFISDRSIEGKLWIMRPDGSQPIQVMGTNANNPFTDPRWRP